MTRAPLAQFSSVGTVCAEGPPPRTDRRAVCLVALAGLLVAIAGSACAGYLAPDDGQLDLSHMLENPHAFLPVPLVVTEPAVGYGLGATALFLRPREEAGDDG